jgi:outer membrane protein insertion porin family
MLAFQVNNGSVNKVYSFTYVNPYWTADGVSRGFDFFRRSVDTDILQVAAYETDTTGMGVRFGIPVTEYDTINIGLTGERTELSVNADAPQRYQQFIAEFGESSDTLRTNVSFARDTRDSLTWPTRGWLNEIAFEVGIPPGDLTYYRATYQSQIFFSPERWSWLTFMLNGEIGYADGYKGKPLPFFKNFYAGGVGSVRAFETATLGPRDTNGDVLGGDRRIVINAEALFPLPGWKERNVRLGVFFDAGNVWGPGEKIKGGDLRLSTGFAVSWDSPVGPLRFSFGAPLRKKEGDNIEKFQFQLGRVF